MNMRCFLNLSTSFVQRVSQPRLSPAKVQPLKSKIAHALTLLILSLTFPLTPAMLPGGRMALAIAQTRLAEGFEPIDIAGRLEAGDRTLDDGSYYDSYTFEGEAGLTLVIEMESAEFDTYLILMDADSNPVVFNDDSDGTNSRIVVTLPGDGMYAVVANSYGAGEAGSYRLTVREGNANPGTGERGDLVEATALMRQAVQLEAQGRYGDAIPLVQQALTIREAELGTEHLLVAESLSSLGSLYGDQGNYAAAEPLQRRALAIREALLEAEHPLVAQSLNNLAVLYTNQGRYAEAIPLYERAIAIIETTEGADHWAVGVSLNNLAEVYLSQGNYAQATEALQRSLALLEQAFGEGHPNVASSLNNLAELYRIQGNYAEAEPLFRRSLALRQRLLGENHPDVADSYNNLAALYADQGNYDEAEDLYQRAIAIEEAAVGENHPDVAQSLNNLAELYRIQGNYGAAEPLYRRSLAIGEAVFGDRHSSVATTLSNLASLYLFQGNYDAAVPLYEQAQTILEGAIGRNHPFTATILNNLGAAYAGQGDTAIAETLYRQSLGILETTVGETHPRVADSLINLGSSAWARGDRATTLTALEQAAEIQETNLELILTVGSEARKRAYLSTLSFHTDMVLSLHLQDAANSSEAAELAITTVLRRKGRVLDATTDSFRALRQQLPPEDQARLDELRAIETQRANLAFSSATRQDTQRLNALEVRAEELRNLLAQRSAEFRSETQPVTLAAIRQQIPADAALVELIRYAPYNPQQERFGTPRYAAYVLLRDCVPRWVDLGDAAALDAQVFAFRDALSNPDSEIAAIARSLNTQLMQPIRELTGNATHLLLSPDGALNLIPFAALMDEDNRYLAERYTFTYLTSGRDLLRMQQELAPSQPPILIANPDYNAPTHPPTAPTTPSPTQTRSSDFGSLTTFAPLPGTQEEVAAIAPLLPNPLLLEGSNATEAALKQVANPSILHIATHGFFLQDQDCLATPSTRSGGRDAYATIESTASTDCVPTPRNVENPLLRSGLVFAGVNQRNQAQGSGEDGVLTAQEVTQMALDGTQLVVLSACETGLGSVVNGDGVYGLRRAFVLAGAESQLMSLWKVDDFGTSELMRGYYERITAGMGRSEALREVQRELLNTGAYGHPYYWAGFIFSGNWRSLEELE